MGGSAATAAADDGATPILLNDVDAILATFLTVSCIARFKMAR
jgi:hypothetical protein